MKNRSILLVIAAVLILSLSIGSALAYFYTYAETEGENKLVLGARTRIDEDPPTSWTKHAIIKNTSESKVPVYVRVKVFSTYSVACPSGWSSSGGYLYYPDLLDPDESVTADLKISGVPAASEENEGEAFSVVVVYECAPAMYENGNLLPSTDARVWKQIIETN